MPHDHSYCLQQSACMSKAHLTDMHASCMQAYLPKPLSLVTTSSVLDGMYASKTPPAAPHMFGIFCKTASITVAKRSTSLWTSPTALPFHAHIATVFWAVYKVYYVAVTCLPGRSDLGPLQHGDVAAVRADSAYILQFCRSRVTCCDHRRQACR